MRKRGRVLALVVGALALVRGRAKWFPVRVDGESMFPTLRPGDFLAVRALHSSEPRRGQLVVVRLGGLEIVKRVIAEPGERALGADEFWVEGDNAAASTDSRSAGPVTRDSIVGVVRARYKPLRSMRRF
jgi:nickel-type superoxide dismutase maturation protease